MPRNGAGTFVLPSGQPVVTGTTISSSTFNALTSDLANALTTSLATDGQTAMSAALPMGGNKITGLGAGTNATDAATVAQLVPAGVILDYGGASAPTGFLACDGSAVSRTTYAALFAAIGGAWGVGDGSTTFNVPDLRRRATIGAGGVAAAGPANTLGAVGGEETHVLTTAELAAHSHAVSITSQNESANHTHGVSDPGHGHTWPYVGMNGTTLGSGSFATGGGSNQATSVDGTGITLGIESASHTHAVSGNTANAGSGSAHNNMQPSAVVNKIIKT